MKEYHLNLFADYFQFYIQDENCRNSLADSWTAFAVENLLAINDGIIGVGTVRNTDIPVKIMVLEEKLNDNNFDHYDLINTCDLVVESEKIVVAGCTDYFPEALRIPLENGIYCLRICYGNLDKLDETGLEGEDFYEVYLWKTEELKGFKTLKSRISSVNN